MIQEISYSQESRILSALRFPLACMVVMSHCGIYQIVWALPDWSNLTANELCGVIQNFFSYTLNAVTVPTFFLMSGYFFFYKTEEFTRQTYFSKIKKRVGTLLVPYLLWNIFYAIKKVAKFLSEGQTLENVRAFFEENGWLRILWDCNKVASNDLGFNLLDIISSPRTYTAPILIPMWFIKDLMIMAVLSPIIYILLRKFKKWAVILCTFIYLMNLWPDIPTLSITAFFFFSVGAYFSINKINMVNELNKLRKFALPLFIVLLVAMTYFNGKDTVGGRIVEPFYIITAIVTTICLATKLEEKGRLTFCCKMSETSFFIYAFHYFLGLWIAVTPLDRIFPLSEDHLFGVMINYLLRPVVTVLACLATYYFMKRFCPRLLNVLTGNRS